MDRPSVSIHKAVSLGGRLTGFPADLGPPHEVAAREPGIDRTGNRPPDPGW